MNCMTAENFFRPYVSIPPFAILLFLRILFAIYFQIQYLIIMAFGFKQRNMCEATMAWYARISMGTHAVAAVSLTWEADREGAGDATTCTSIALNIMSRAVGHHRSVRFWWDIMWWVASWDRAFLCWQITYCHHAASVSWAFLFRINLIFCRAVSVLFLFQRKKGQKSQFIKDERILPETALMLSCFM
jgi:hypothetical protein